MANPRIEVEIGAVIDGLRKGFGESVGIIGALEKQALELDKALRAATTVPEIANLNAKLAQTKSAITQLKNTGIEPLTKATSQFNVVGLDFARVIQDAPYGIIGVGNNITQLAQSFSGLGKAGDTLGSKVKLAFSQIFSSGNALILGVSVLTTAFTILQQKGFFDTEEAAKSLDEQLEEYRDTLEGVAKATLEGTISSQKEILSLKLLQTQAQNTNLTIEKRLAAVNDLKKQYPEYLKNLTDEEILAGNVGDAYKSLTTDILALAKAKAFSSQIDKNTANSLTLLLQEEERAIQILQKRADLQSLVAQKGRGEQGGQFVAGQDVGLAGQIRDITKEIDELTKETVKSAQERAKLAEQNLKLESGIVDFSSQGASFARIKTEETKKNVKESENLKRTFEDLSKIDFFVDTAKLERTDAFFIQVEKQLTSLESGVASTRGIYTENIAAITQSNLALSESLEGTGISSEQFYAAIANGAAEGFSSLDSFISKLSETQQFINETFAILEQGAENTLGDVAFSIGDALAGGGNVIKAAGAALLGGIAGILNQLGQLAIGAGLAVEGIKKALTSLNGPVAIAAGVALIALAGFVSNKAKSLGTSKGGGGGGGGGASAVGSSGVGGGTSFAGGGQGGLFQQNRDLNGELVVRGQDLVYVFGQANNKINKG